MASFLAQPANRARVGLLVIAVLAVMRFVVVPLYQWQNQMLEELAVLERYQSRSANPEYGQALQQRHQAYEKALAALEKQLPRAESINTLQFRAQQTLEQLAKAESVTIQRTDWGIAAPDESLLQAPMRVRMEGQVDQLHRLLQRLESPQQAFRVQGFTFQPDSRERYNYTLELNLEALALPQQSGGNDQEGPQ